MRVIDLGKNQYAIVDDEDFPVLNRLSWNLPNIHKTFPCCSFKNSENGVTYNMPITKFLFPNKNNGARQFQTLNGNYLDCRKENIILISDSLKRQKQRKTSRPTSSKYKGVCRANRQPSPWRAYIVFNSKHICIGYFKTEHEAAKAYNEKAREFYGEHAYQNLVK